MSVVSSYLYLSIMKRAESAKVEIDAYEAAENELVVIEQELCSAETVPSSSSLFFLFPPFFIFLVFCTLSAGSLYLL